jgi:hypothetical protein
MVSILRCRSQVQASCPTVAAMATSVARKTPGLAAPESVMPRLERMAWADLRIRGAELVRGEEKYDGKKIEKQLHAAITGRCLVGRTAFCYDCRLFLKKKPCDIRSA